MIASQHSTILRPILLLIQSTTWQAYLILAGLFSLIYWSVGIGEKASLRNANETTGVWVDQDLYWANGAGASGFSKGLQLPQVFAIGRRDIHESSSSIAAWRNQPSVLAEHIGEKAQENC